MKMSSESRSRSTPTRVQSRAYRPASEDLEFLAMDDLRPLRLQLELLKPEWYLRQEEIRSTIVVFGSARILPPDTARRQVLELERAVRGKPSDPQLQSKLARARKRQTYSRYYEEARRFSAFVSHRFQEIDRRDFVVVTGGGPGIMEAANRGAREADARSIGFNITLPHEQEPNPFVSPELSFQFRYFAIRKMHFLLRAKALVAFPGGYGTMDELFEVLTLIQTKKIAPMPVVLIGRDFWTRAIDFDFLVEDAVVDPDDIALFQIVDRADEAIQIVHDFYGGRPPE
ncbi:hypothetical protein DFR46_2862 [Parasphingopyxis lamellibrachiae]|uniref:AMP nucleosidase n=2 Tax=Parasphingopyxis lamellibrachiae TaxID=680125 RepID=A0A3D9FJH5_9SPHN|nr:hypothetical protein DFR46_2862 [Parasphingopyxis lamellibrachiae]